MGNETAVTKSIKTVVLAALVGFSIGAPVLAGTMLSAAHYHQQDEAKLAAAVHTHARRAYALDVTGDTIPVLTTLTDAGDGSYEGTPEELAATATKVQIALSAIGQTPACPRATGRALLRVRTAVVCRQVPPLHCSRRRIQAPPEVRVRVQQSPQFLQLETDAAVLPRTDVWVREVALGNQLHQTSSDGRLKGCVRPAR